MRAIPRSTGKSPDKLKTWPNNAVVQDAPLGMENPNADERRI